MSESEAKIINDDASSFFDGLQNLMSSMGTPADKREHSSYVNRKLLSHDGNQKELESLYRTNWVAGKIVDIIPADMVREWRKFKSDIEPETIKDIVDEETRLKLKHSCEMAMRWSRLFGTAYIVLSIDDGQEPNKPLNIDLLKPGCIRHITVVDRHRVDNNQNIIDNDPMSANFGMPTFYRFRETNVDIHHSRMIRFDGIDLPYDALKHNNYNADSILDRLYEALLNFDSSTNGTASMIMGTNVDIIKIKGLMALLSSPETELLLKKRFALASLMKSYNNALLLDTEEEWTKNSNNFSGLADLLDRYGQYLVAGADIPATRMFGSSASGFNATGEGDLKNYYDNVGADQKNKLKPKIDYFDKVFAKHLGLELDDLEYEFNPLFQMTPKEISEIAFNNAQSDSLYLDRGVLDEATVAKELKERGTYTNITDDHISDLSEIDEGDDLDDEIDSNTQTGEIKEPGLPKENT